MATTIPPVTYEHTARVLKKLANLGHPIVLVGGQAKLATLDDMNTPSTGAVIFTDENNHTRQIDFLGSVAGVDDAELIETAASATLDDEHGAPIASFLVMNPLLCLKSRVHNVAYLPGYQTDHAKNQLRAAIICAKQFAVDQLASDPRKTLACNEVFFDIARYGAGVEVFALHGIDVLEALVEAPGMPDKFYSERLPRARAADRTSTSGKPGAARRHRADDRSRRAARAGAAASIDAARPAPARRCAVVGSAWTGEPSGGEQRPACDRLVYERQRHARFVGRADLLARLDRQRVADTAQRWVVVIGGPGMGKRAVLAAWLARREAAGEIVPHHFIRRGWSNWDDPEALVDSLVAQIEARFPDLREAEAGARLAPAARLAAALQRVSERALEPRGERLVLLIDGLDEYDPRPGSPHGDPLGTFLPYALPTGVSVLCASRPRHPYVDSLATRGVRCRSISTTRRALPTTTPRPCARSGRRRRPRWVWMRRSSPRRWSAPVATCSMR